MSLANGSADASSLRVDAAFGRGLDSWLSLYRVVLSVFGLLLNVVLFWHTPWPVFSTIYLVLSALVMPLLVKSRSEREKGWVRSAILLADVCMVTLFVFIWGTRASPAVFMYVPIVVGWTLAPQLGLGRMALLLSLAALSGLLLAEPDDWVSQTGVQLEPASEAMSSPAGGLMFFGLVSGSLVTVHALLKFTVARLRKHSLAVSNLLSERASRVRDEEWARQLREAERLEAIGRLAGGVAHDFNNLLTALLGCAEVAERSLASNPELARKSIFSIRQAAERGSGLTAQLLDFASRRPTQPKEVDLNQRITETVQLLSRLLKDSVIIVTELPDEACGVCIDPSGLERLLLNLAVNAADAMPQGGRLTIRVLKRESEQARLAVLEVQDQGTGIESEDLPHIFEPFFTRKARGKGTGLGLASVYGIVKQSHGEISVESPAEGGTLFRITWPAIALSTTTTHERVAEDVDRRQHGTVLLVDDDKVVREVATDHLRAAGYDVLPASSGSEALRELSSHQSEVDVLVTDVSMPGMSGFELAAAVRGAVPELPVLFISGYADECGESPPALNDARLLAKPFSSDRLIAEMRAAMSRRRGLSGAG